MTTMYRLKRRHELRGMRTKYGVTKRIVQSIKDGAVIIGVAVGMLMLWNTAVLGAAIEREQGLKEKLEAVWIGCLIHGATYIDGELTACKPVNTKFRKEQKHLEDVK